MVSLIISYAEKMVEGTSLRWIKNGQEHCEKPSMLITFSITRLIIKTYFTGLIQATPL
jgi:hypothetical protein